MENTIYFLVAAFIIGAASKYLAQKGWLLIINKWAGKTKEATKEAKETLDAVEEFADFIESATADNDFTADEVKQAWTKGKKVVVESKDIIAVFTKKK